MAKRANVLLGIRKPSVDRPGAVSRKTTPGKHRVVPRCPSPEGDNGDPVDAPSQTLIASPAFTPVGR